MWIISLIIVIVNLVMLLFIYSALKISSMCYTEEEMEEINGEFEENFYE